MIAGRQHFDILPKCCGVPYRLVDDTLLAVAVEESPDVSAKSASPRAYKDAILARHRTSGCKRRLGTVIRFVIAHVSPLLILHVRLLFCLQCVAQFLHRLSSFSIIFSKIFSKTSKGRNSLRGMISFSGFLGSMVITWGVVTLY
jgi:hypothetical protein